MRYLLILFLIFSIKAEAVQNQITAYLNNDSLWTLPKNTEVKITYTTGYDSLLDHMVLRTQFNSDTGMITSEFPLTIPTKMETTKTYTLLYKIPDYFVLNSTPSMDWAPGKTLGIYIDRYVKDLSMPSHPLIRMNTYKKEFPVMGEYSFTSINSLSKDYNFTRISIYHHTDTIQTVDSSNIPILKTNTDISLKYLTNYDSTVDLVSLTLYHISRDWKDTFNVYPTVILRNPENTLTNSTYSTSFKVSSDTHPDTVGFYRLMVKEVRRNGELAHLPYYQTFYAPRTTTSIHPIIRTSHNKPAKYPLTDILGRASISVPNFQVVW